MGVSRFKCTITTCSDLSRASARLLEIAAMTAVLFTPIEGTLLVTCTFGIFAEGGTTVAG